MKCTEACTLHHLAIDTCLTEQLKMTTNNCIASCTCHFPVPSACTSLQSQTCIRLRLSHLIMTNLSGRIFFPRKVMKKTSLTSCVWLGEGEKKKLRKGENHNIFFLLFIHSFFLLRETSPGEKLVCWLDW